MGDKWRDGDNLFEMEKRIEELMSMWMNTGEPWRSEYARSKLIPANGYYGYTLLKKLESPRSSKIKF